MSHKQITVRVEPEFYENLQTYVFDVGSTVAGYCRSAIRNAFISSLESDKQFLDLIKRNLEEAENYGLSTKQRAELEKQESILEARVKAFEEIYFDLVAEREGEYA